MAVVEPEGIGSLNLIQTWRCDLACAYCFQDRRRRDVMSAEVMRNAIDLLMRSRRPALELAFTGGEPLLEFPLIREAVDYAEARRPEGRRLACVLTTNGLHLDGEVLSFVAAHDVQLRLSFDGVRAAQERRGRGTFAVLDRLLDTLVRNHRPFVLRNLRVCVTVAPDTIRFLADSVEYLIEKGVERIAISPVISAGGTAGASPRGGDPGAALPAEFARVFEISRRYLHRTGRVPVMLFDRERDEPTPTMDGDGAVCAAMSGAAPAVAPDGIISSCTVLAGALHHVPPGPRHDALAAMTLGHVGDLDDIRRRYRELPDRARRAGLFDRKGERYSSRGRCGECSYQARCVVCPMSRGSPAGDGDPLQVDDFECAFNRAALACRDRFPPRVSLTEIGTATRPRM